MSLPVLVFFALSTVLAAESDSPSTAPTVTASGMVLDGKGSVVWRPGRPSIRHGNGQVAWSNASRTCFDEAGKRVLADPCEVHLNDAATLLVTRSDAAVEASVVLVRDLTVTPKPVADPIPEVASVPAGALAGR